MASLARAIHSFQTGSLTHNEFLAQVDRALASDQADSVRQLEEVLKDEHTRVVLPPDVYAELQRRADYLTDSKHGGGDQTRIKTSQTNRGRVTSHPTSQSGWPGGQAEQALERVKGVGDTLNGRFVLEECIGFGGMGTVYKALDLRKLEASDRKPYIAIKVLNLQFRGHPKSLITLQREARKAQQLAHPNIVMVYDFDRDGSTVYLTMEYLAGKPLSQVLREKGFAGMPYADAMRIVNGMGKALAYAHERGFVHCDFKPANVILTDKGEVKVIDFGIARVFRKADDDNEATVFDPGSLGGMTPAYASPEILEHRDPDPRDDIYALACITYELLTGRHPFDRFPALHARSAGMKPPRPHNLGGRQWRALKAALSFDRETRTPSVERFLSEMNVQRRPLVYAVAATAALVVVALGLGIVGYFWKSTPKSGEVPPVVVAPPEKPAPAVPAAPPAVKKPAPAVPALTLAAVVPVLAKVPCSALAPSVRGHEVQVHGYLAKEFGVARLKEMLGEVPGVQTLNVNVQQVGSDKCSVIQAFGPYWSRTRLAGAGATIRTKAPNAELKEGDPLIVDVTTPGYQTYVNVDYYVLDGSVVHLVPSSHAKANQAPPNYSATIGSLGNWVISKPFGNELIVLIETPEQLFDSMRPESEPKADYLRAVEKRFAQIADKYGPEKIAVDLVQITTVPRK